MLGIKNKQVYFVLLSLIAIFVAYKNTTPDVAYCMCDARCG